VQSYRVIVPEMVRLHLHSSRDPGRQRSCRLDENIFESVSILGAAVRRRDEAPVDQSTLTKETP
jgi:hypothetical protein